MLIGYVRVSTLDQKANLQTDALKTAGCKKIFKDKISCTTAERPGLVKVKELLRKGDTLVGWRLGRSLKNLLEGMTWLDQEGIAPQKLTGK